MNELLVTAAELKHLRQELAFIARAISPWIEMAEMCQRYGVCSKTMLAMERRGDIPARVRGRWKREEVMQAEAA
jgi:hypothetical protein